MNKKKFGEINLIWSRMAAESQDITQNKKKKNLTDTSLFQFIVKIQKFQQFFNSYAPSTTVISNIHYKNSIKNDLHVLKTIRTSHNTTNR